MITKIRIKNFKKLDDVEIDLGSAVVFVGPNNSGKTSLLQAISLWELGMRRWAENRKKTSAKKRVGVTINRRDIVSIPVPSAVQLWQNLRVRKGVKENDRISTKNISIKWVLLF
ncbi:MAG: AAA family ATPase [Calditrichaeota bacterium]|nr:AAA family ATPase [Calditrichota bacterium]